MADTLYGYSACVVQLFYTCGLRGPLFFFTEQTRPNPIHTLFSGTYRLDELGIT